MGLLARLLGRDAEGRDPVPERDPDDRVAPAGIDARLLPIGNGEALTQLALALARGQFASVELDSEPEAGTLRIEYAHGAFVLRGMYLTAEWEDGRRG